MTVSIGYRPHNPSKLTYVDGGSSFWQILEDEFGDGAIIGINDLEFLRGIAACGYDGANALINAINKHEKIQIKAEW